MQLRPMHERLRSHRLQAYRKAANPRIRASHRCRCGLPAGPFGLIGAAEGISYLVVIGFVAAALLSKVTSGKGLPAGPGGLLGAAEGLSFLTALAGLAVLGFQLTDYGYVPEAVPIEGGVCTTKFG